MKRFSKEWWFHSEPCTGVELCGEYKSMTIPPIMVLILGIVGGLSLIGLILIGVCK